MRLVPLPETDGSNSIDVRTRPRKFYPSNSPRPPNFIFLRPRPKSTYDHFTRALAVLNSGSESKRGTADSMHRCGFTLKCLKPSSSFQNQSSLQHHRPKSSNLSPLAPFPQCSCRRRASLVRAPTLLRHSLGTLGHFQHNPPHGKTAAIMHTTVSVCGLRINLSTAVLIGPCPGEAWRTKGRCHYDQPLAEGTVYWALGLPAVCPEVFNAGEMIQGWSRRERNSIFLCRSATFLFGPHG